MDSETLLENRKARHNYEVTEIFHAGMELMGHEAKALKMKRGDITGGHVILRGGEAYAVNVDIPPYQPGNVPAGYDAKRARRLLLTRGELNELVGKLHKSGLTLIPLRVYIQRRLVKMDIGLGRGRKKSDKREAIKNREWSRLRRNIEAR
jgi:SsrA-binding protein